MIIADPWGSWVKGAQAGLDDAIKLRQAQDKTALSNMGLYDSALRLPDERNILRDQANNSRMQSDVQRRLMDLGLLDEAAIGDARTHALAPGKQLAELGITGALTSGLNRIYPEANVATDPNDPTSEAVRFYQGLDPNTGREQYTLNPMDDIQSPRLAHDQELARLRGESNAIRAQHYQNQDAARIYGLENGVTGMRPRATGSIFTGNPSSSVGTGALQMAPPAAVPKAQSQYGTNAVPQGYNIQNNNDFMNMYGVPGTTPRKRTTREDLSNIDSYPYVR